MLDYGGGASEEAGRLGDKARRCPSPLGLFSPASSPCAAVSVPTHAFQPGPPAGLGSLPLQAPAPPLRGWGVRVAAAYEPLGLAPAGQRRPAARVTEEAMQPRPSGPCSHLR